MKAFLMMSLLVSSVSMAGTVGIDLKDLECANKAVEAATLKNSQYHGSDSGSCGARLLAAGDYLETYLVCTTDETDASEWVLILQKASMDKNGNIKARCVVKSAEPQYDSQTPNFEEDTKGLLKTKTCQASHDEDSGKTKVKCK